MGEDTLTVGGGTVGGRIKDSEVMTLLTVHCEGYRVAASTSDVHCRYVDSGSTCVLSGVGCEEGVKGQFVGAAIEYPR